MKNKTIRWFAAALLGCVLSLQIGVASAEIKQLNNDELQTLISQGVAVIDVRREEEWRHTGVVEGAHLLTFFDKHGRYDVGSWLASFEKIASKDTPFVLICAAGVRSSSIANLLDARLGYSGVHNVKKGINDWIAKGKPVVAYGSKP